MSEKKVSWNITDGVATVTIDNPPANALSRQVGEEIIEAMEFLCKDYQVRVIIITGKGNKFFMAGADINEFPQMVQGKVGSVAGAAQVGHMMYNAIDFCSKPTIAAIEGMALGGGCELALACDLRICSENAQIGLPEVKLGLLPGGGGTQRLPRLVGEAKAKELMFVGDFVDAHESLRIGLVNKVVPEGEALNAALQLALKISRRPSIAVNLIKQCVDRGLEVPLLNGLKIEADLFDRVFQSEDVKEGVAAFLEKRKPDFRHR